VPESGGNVVEPEVVLEPSPLEIDHKLRFGDSSVLGFAAGAGDDVLTRSSNPA
jgi:hypothetical protein